MNGGSPPVTFNMFNHVIESIGKPPRPLPDVNLTDIPFADLSPTLRTKIKMFSSNHVLINVQ